MNPLLLQGDPGLGKTYFVKELANRLGLPYFEISLATTSASFALCGGSLQWSEGTVGEIAKVITNSEVANPVVLLDEVDKCNQNSKFDPANVLYGILEPHTAKRFKDEALELELDLSHVIWVATANYPDWIPQPIRSRMRSFDIKQPSPEAMKCVVQNMYEHFRRFHPCGSYLSSNIDSDIVAQLSYYSPREIRITLNEAAMKALKRGSKELTLADVQTKKSEEIHRVGFI
jgi:ATP-dependent Lon protease